MFKEMFTKSKFSNISSIYSADNPTFEKQLYSFLYKIFGTALKRVKLNKRKMYFNIELKTGTDFWDESHLAEIKSYGFTKVTGKGIKFKAYFEANVDDDEDDIRKFTDKQLKDIGLSFK